MGILVTGRQAAEIDNYSIDEFGMKSEVLMERAALSAADYICSVNAGNSVFIMAGMGNNGADGIALARILCQRGYLVKAVLAGNISKSTQQWKYQFNMIRKMDADIVVCESEKQLMQYQFPRASIYVDALFGVGLSRAITGMYKEAIELWNKYAAKYNAFRLALDICSGINADTGEIMGTCTKADATTAFGYAKRGHYLFPGAYYTGKLTVSDIGLSKAAIAGKEAALLSYIDRNDAKNMLPDRKPWGNKGTFGKVLIFAGTIGMAGAAFFAAKSAYLSGAGLVRILTVSDNREILQQLIPQAVISFYDELNDEQIENLINEADVIAAGPGIGKSTAAEHILNLCIKHHGSKPLVIDADGLNIIAMNSAENLGENVIFTPHPGELSRLLKMNISELKQDMVKASAMLAQKYNVLAICKDARTIITLPPGKQYINIYGNDGMAAGGSGDILSGIIAGLSAQGISAADAALLGVYLHAAAGDIGAMKYTRYGLTAEKLMECIPETIKSIEK